LYQCRSGNFYAQCPSCPFLVMYTTPHDSLIVKDAQSANLLILDGSQAMRARQATARQLDTAWLSNRYAGNTFKEPRNFQAYSLATMPLLSLPMSYSYLSFS
jgi:hypothetical protein